MGIVWEWDVEIYHGMYIGIWSDIMWCMVHTGKRRDCVRICWHIMEYIRKIVEWKGDMWPRMVMLAHECSLSYVDANIEVNPICWGRLSVWSRRDSWAQKERTCASVDVCSHPRRGAQQRTPIHFNRSNTSWFSKVVVHVLLNFISYLSPFQDASLMFVTAHGEARIDLATKSIAWNQVLHELVILANPKNLLVLCTNWYQQWSRMGFIVGWYQFIQNLLHGEMIQTIDTNPISPIPYVQHQ